MSDETNEEFVDDVLVEETDVEESSEDAEITEEELDHIADTAIAVLQDILKHFDVGEVTIDEYEGDEGELILDITGDDLAVLIGRHGKTLDALQFLVSAITVRSIGFRYPVVVDVLLMLKDTNLVRGKNSSLLLTRVQIARQASSEALNFVL